MQRDVRNETINGSAALDSETVRAVRVFVRLLQLKYAPLEILVFGSRARLEHDQESDADVAVILEGKPGNRWSVARDMARIAFDAMLETGILVDPLPLWEDEMRHPERLGNPALIHNIRREGLHL